MRHHFTAAGPGRPAGAVSGRRAALAILDEVLADADNQRVMKEALSAYLRKSPVACFKTIVIPLLPQEARLELAGSALASPWLDLREVCRTPAAAIAQPAPAALLAQREPVDVEIGL